MITTRKASALILLAIPAAILLAYQARAEKPPAPAPVALVERVVDGDTVVVRLDGQSIKVRLIGVDAPESVDPRKPVQRFARESAAFLRQLVEGKTAHLVTEYRIGDSLGRWTETLRVPGVGAQRRARGAAPLDTRRNAGSELAAQDVAWRRVSGGFGAQAKPMRSVLVG
jgi:endonuclease YncB( thermonuclease family)